MRLSREENQLTGSGEEIHLAVKTTTSYRPNNCESKVQKLYVAEVG
jgi:hypothetical protein